MPSFHTYPHFPSAQLRAAPGENTCQWALKSSWLSHEPVGGKNTQTQQTSTSSQAGYRWETTREETDSAKSSGLMEASLPRALETEAPLPLRSCHGGHLAEAHHPWQSWSSQHPVRCRPTLRLPWKAHTDYSKSLHTPKLVSSILPLLTSEGRACPCFSNAHEYNQHHLQCH